MKEYNHIVTNTFIMGESQVMEQTSITGTTNKPFIVHHFTDSIMRVLIEYTCGVQPIRACELISHVNYTPAKKAWHIPVSTSS